MSIYYSDVECASSMLSQALLNVSPFTFQEQHSAHDEMLRQKLAHNAAANQGNLNARSVSQYHNSDESTAANKCRVCGIALIEDHAKLCGFHDALWISYQKNPPITLKNKIQEVRLGMTLTPDQLSKIIEVSIVTIGFWEDGAELPCLEILEKLAIACKVSLSYFFTPSCFFTPRSQDVFAESSKNTPVHQTHEEKKILLGEKIKKAREAKGWERGFLAEKICVSKDTLRNWEDGCHRPQPFNLKKLSAELRVPLKYFQD